MRIRLFKRKKSGLHFFQFLSDHDEAILDSQGYQTKESRSTGIASVYSNAGDST
ncbi:MAG: YegP family protein, partial [Bacteroidia bacterium]|nr:YegP family protein [Bacteroidia bacterium]